MVWGPEGYKAIEHVEVSNASAVQFVPREIAPRFRW